MPLSSYQVPPLDKMDRSESPGNSIVCLFKICNVNLESLLIYLITHVNQPMYYLYISHSVVIYQTQVKFLHSTSMLLEYLIKEKSLPWWKVYA